MIFFPSAFFLSLCVLAISSQAKHEADRPDEVCSILGEECRCQSPCLDDIFDDHGLSLALLQRKAKRVQASVVAELVSEHNVHLSKQRHVSPALAAHDSGVSTPPARLKPFASDAIARTAGRLEHFATRRIGRSVADSRYAVDFSLRFLLKLAIMVPAALLMFAFICIVAARANTAASNHIPDLRHYANSEKSSIKSPSSARGPSHKPDPTSRGGPEMSDVDTAVTAFVPARDENPGLCQIIFSFALYLPLQVFAITSFGIVVLLHQLLILPFRIRGGRPLTQLLKFFGPLMSCLVYTFIAINFGEPCYGRDMDTLVSHDDFLKTCSASKRKNIRRNYKAATKELQKREIQATLYPAGTWRITYEILSLVWHQCNRHTERAYGFADITHCWRPVSSPMVLIGELLFLLVFPCDIQLFRTKDGKLVSLNSRVHIGNVYMNPNYAAREDHSQIGIYCSVNWDIVQEAIRLRATVLNVMPSMRAAKKALGLRSLPFFDTLLASLTFTNEPQESMNEERATTQTVSQRNPKGGKRAARKKAAVQSTAGKNAGEQESSRSEVSKKEQVSEKSGASQYHVEKRKTILTVSKAAKSHCVETTATKCRPSFLDTVEYQTKTGIVSKATPKGGKRAARKKAEADAQCSGNLGVGYQQSPKGAFESQSTSVTVHACNDISSCSEASTQPQREHAGTPRQRIPHCSQGVVSATNVADEPQSPMTVLNCPRNGVDESQGAAVVESATNDPNYSDGVVADSERSTTADEFQASAQITAAASVEHIVDETCTLEKATAGPARSAFEGDQASANLLQTLRLQTLRQSFADEAQSSDDGIACPKAFVVEAASVD